MNTTDGRGRQRLGGLAAASAEFPIEAVEIGGVQLREAGRPERRQQVAVDNAAGLEHRLRRKITPGVFEPTLKQFADQYTCRGQDTSFSFRDERGQGAFGLALGALHRAGGVQPLAVERIAPEEGAQLP